VHGLVNPITTYKFEVYGEGNEVVQDAAYYGRNRKILERVAAAAKETGGTMPNPETQYHEVKETRVWSVIFQRRGDEFGREADPVRQVSEDWKVIGDPVKIRPIRRL
jgi:hypothetical protein